MNKKIIMTGGGSAGHVTPNIALFERLKELNYDIEYIGTEKGIERSIIEKEKIKYHVISSGKLRRYFDVKNFTDPFKVVKGIFQSYRIIKKVKPNVVFSKGGFVSVPVVIGAHLNKVPVISHESDITPGLANKLCTPYCTKVCVTFPETLKYIDSKKAVLTGTPVRSELKNGNRLIGIKKCGFDMDKPILLVIGGSLGSKFINDVIRKNIKKFLSEYQIIHICGKGNIDKNLENVRGYRQFEFVEDDLKDFLKASDIVISRAGANVIFELLTLKKPNILVPLSKKSSRGDQILNANSFKKCGYSEVIQEEELTCDLLLEKLNEVYKNREKYIENMKKSSQGNSIDIIINLIEKYSTK